MNVVKRSWHKPLQKIPEYKVGRLHFFVNKRNGILFSSSRISPVVKHKKGIVTKYLGWSDDADWPKKLNNGRIINYYPPKKKLPKKENKLIP